MRRYPNSIRAVAMKGIVPPSMAMPETHARAGEDAWQSLRGALPQGRGVRTRPIPLVEVEFRELLKRLESNPVMTLPASQQRPETKIRVSRGLFAEAFRNVLYTPEGSAQAPKLIHQLVNGDDRGLVETALAGRTVLGGERLAAGFFLSVTCTEDVPYLSKDADAMAAGTFGGNYRLEQQRAACKEWPRGTVSSAHRQPTKSAIPTLLLSGEFDPVTPPSGAEEVARGLSKGRHIVIRNNGHPIGNAEACIGKMIGQFLDRRVRRRRRCNAAPPPIPAPPFVIPGKTTMTNVLSDLKHGLRVLLRTPLFTICTIAALAIGIGATTALFSVVHALLIKPLPYKDAESLVVMWEHNLPRNRPRNVISPANFLAVARAQPIVRRAWRRSRRTA